ncbi:MAG TPA: sulfotransferase [Elusimicrobiota bacterium]|nr:sulfotransferase [Elusimicrobiota bacterium]
MESASPVFIIGTERSGSNLLRLMLNQHPAFAIPHPPHIMKEMMPLEPLYGDLSDDRRFRRLVEDTVELVRLHFYPWDGPLDPDAVFAEAPARSVYGIKAALYDQYRRAKGKRRWGCKSTFVVHYADLVRRVSPDAKFVHLVRDGRDVAVSAKRSVFNHFHPHYVGRLWSAQQREALALAARLPADALLAVRYEDLLEDPAREVRRVCAFLGEEYFPGLLDYHRSGEASSLAAESASWENVDKPVLKENRAKYKRGLSAREIRAFEVQAFAELKAFGYPLENEEAGLRDQAARGPGAAARLEYWLRERAMSGWMDLKSLASDRNALRRLRKALFVRRLRLSLASEK